MPKVLDDLRFEMSMMFIDNILKTYDIQDVTEESKVKYLKRIIQYCERKYDQEYEPQKSGAADGWLLVKEKRRQVTRCGLQRRVEHRKTQRLASGPVQLQA